MEKEGLVKLGGASAFKPKEKLTQFENGMLNFYLDYTVCKTSSEKSAVFDKWRGQLLGLAMRELVKKVNSDALVKAFEAECKMVTPKLTAKQLKDTVIAYKRGVSDCLTKIMPV